MVFDSKVTTITYDILRGVNATIWEGINEAEKVGKIVKTGLSGADVIVGASHAMENFSCSDYVYCSLDVIGSVSSAVDLVLGNIPSTKHLTLVTGSVTVGCRSVRYYCKKYGTFWGCAVAAGQGIKHTIQFPIKS